MKHLGKWTVAYGIFLIVIGLTGYLSNPERAKTALMSGGTFGVISIIWGLLLLRGISWARIAVLCTTLFLSVIFLWRASVSWSAVAQGEAEKMLAAVLISLMLAASATLLAVIARARKPAPKPLA